MKPYVCVPCKHEMYVEKNGVVALERTSDDGIDCRIFLYDKWKCPVCQHEVLLGHGDPIYPHEDGYKRYKKEVEITFW